MRPLVALVSGSRAYGTAVPASDTDLKGVHVPAPEDIVMQRAKGGERMTLEDRETFALHRFLEMVADGHPLAIEMLFTPDTLLAGRPDPVWLDILANRQRLLTSTAKFGSYSKGQAEAFFKKSDRIEALRAVLAAIDAAIAGHGPDARLEAAYGGLSAAAKTWKAIELTERASAGRTLTHVSACDKHAPMTGSLSAARATFAAALERYGDRALKASEDGGVAWKPLMHALRLAEEGVEYHTTGQVTLPRPNAPYLRSVRLGERPLGEVEAAIRDANARQQAAEAASVMPAEPDRAWMEGLVLRVYGSEVASHFSAAPAATGAGEKRRDTHAGTAVSLDDPLGGADADRPAPSPGR